MFRTWIKSTLLTALFLTSAWAVAAPAYADTWQIDSAHSNAEFKVRHLMVSFVKGSFSKLTGTVETDGKNFAKAKVEATIDVNTISTGEVKRDDHLKSPDFFDAAKFPTITFKSTKIKSLGGDKIEMSGRLTMHGITKKVTLTGIVAPAIKDPFGLIRMGAAVTTKINREDYGLTWNKALEAGGVAVGKDVIISIDVEFTKKPTTASNP